MSTLFFGNFLSLDKTQLQSWDLPLAFWTQGGTQIQTGLNNRTSGCQQRDKGVACGTGKSPRGLEKERLRDLWGAVAGAFENESGVCGQLPFR